MTIARNMVALVGTLTLMAWDHWRRPEPVRGWNPPRFTYEEQD